MSKKQLLIILGVWMMVFLFLGFPSYLDKILSLITGILVILVALKFASNTKPVPASQMPFKEYKNASHLSNTNNANNIVPTLSSPSSSTETITKTQSPENS